MQWLSLECIRGLYITNLPYGASEEEIRVHFETLGEVQSVVVCKERNRMWC